MKTFEDFPSLSDSSLQERGAYEPLAENGSRLYFVISDLCKINNMYRFSLAAFLRLFQRALGTKEVGVRTKVSLSTVLCSVLSKKPLDLGYWVGTQEI